MSSVPLSLLSLSLSHVFLLFIFFFSFLVNREYHVRCHRSFEAAGLPAAFLLVVAALEQAGGGVATGGAAALAAAAAALSAVLNWEFDESTGAATLALRALQVFKPGKCSFLLTFLLIVFVALFRFDILCTLALRALQVFKSGKCSFLFTCLIGLIRFDLVSVLVCLLVSLD
jgi:hypothetical protein